MTLGERIRWIIIDTINHKSLSNEKIAKVLGCNQSTINNYRHQKSVPGADFIESFCEKFNVNPVWIITGEGEAYIKEGGAQTPTEYPKLEELDLQVKEPVVEYKNQEEFKIADALTMTARVLESGTSYATALYLNIQHFDRAIRTEIRMTQLEKRLDALESKIAGDNPGEALIIDKAM